MSIATSEETGVAEEAAPIPSSVIARGRFRPIVAAASPTLAAAVGLAVHFALADAQLMPMSWLDKVPAWRHPYPLVLEFLAALGAFLTVGQWASRPLRSWARQIAPIIAGATLVMTVWELITLKFAWMPQPYFPGPDEVFAALFEDRAMLAESAWHSLRLLLCGYLAGATAGIICGVLMGWFRLVRYWGMPVLKFVGPIPATALVPLVMMISRESFVCGVVLIGYAVWFPVTMLTASGVANVRISYLDVARTLGAGRLYLIFRVAIPSALPNIFIGLFIGLTVSFLTLIVAETIGVKAGLGWYLLWQKGYAEYAKVYASLIIMAAFFSTIMTLLFKFRDYVLKWQRGVIRW
jgi:sulfonate transport system permease protein